MVVNVQTRQLPLIDIAGPAAVRGEQYGMQARQYIQQSIATYRAAFLGLGIGWDSACRIAGSYVAELEQREQDLLEEVRGIARGAGLAVEEILALNCRTEIIYGHNGDCRAATDGCTGAVLLPQATTSGHLLHGQNWDWRDETAESAIVLRITRGDGPSILTQTEAGCLARCGLNSAGLALTGNFLKCERDNQPNGIPIPFIRRHILEQTSFSKAVGIVMNTPKSFSTNLMLSHAGGEAVDLETVPDECFWLQPENGILVHANHFECAAARAKLRDEGLKIAPCSLHRSDRVRRYLEARHGKLSLEHMQEAFGDRFDAPFSVCAEPDHGPGGDTSATVATILMDVTERRMWVAPRPYLEHGYTEYGFED